MKRRALLDAHAVVVYLKREPGYRKVLGCLREAERENLELYISDFNLGEVSFWVHKNRYSMAPTIMSTILQLPLEHLPLTLDTLISAGKLRSQHPVSYGDCIAVLEALSKEATIVTGDSDFKRFETIVPIDWL